MTDQTGSDPTAGDRLDGWKRIAAYLNRDVRTVRRWEKHQGLPVRRLMHDRQATVYAYRHELDAWLRDQDERAAASPAGSKGQPGKPGRKWAWAAAPLLVIAAVVAWFWPDTEHPAIAFGEWDWVLVTEFDNRTGEEILDGTVEYALQRELANSRYVKVVPPDRVADTLRLMQLPPDTRIDAETGREVSLRDGGIKILISGRTEKIGNRYSISADLIKPSDGVSLASFSETATGQDEILPAVGELARSVRSTLGEGLASITESEEALAKVTTPSLEALRLFSQANLLMATDDRIRALAILEEAVRIDPDFASAHLLLFYALKEREQNERATQHLERAVALADRATERERLFILATYYGFLDDVTKEIDTYHLLLRLYPDHYWANGNLSNILEEQGQFEESERFRVRVRELRPNSSVAWYPDLDIVNLAIANDHKEVLDKYFARLESAVEQPGYGWLQPFVILMPVHQAWDRGEYEAALAQLEGIVAAMDEQDLVANGWLFANIRSDYLALGKLQRFRELSALREAKGWFEVVLDYESGNPETLERYVEENSRDFWYAVLLALAGKPEQAKALANDPELLRSVQPIQAGPDLKRLALGQAAFAEGRFEEAISILEQIDLLNITYKWAYLFGMGTLAQAYERVGDVGKAIETLEYAARQKPLTIFETAGTFFWQRNQVYLHDLYLKTGQQAAADRVEAELRDMLRLADPDHPFLVRLDAARANASDAD